MRQDKNQPETQTSENITEYGTEACIPAEAEQEHGDCTDKGSTSPEESDACASDDKDSKERWLWGFTTWLMFLAEVIAIIFVIGGLIVGINALIAAVSYVVLFISFFAIIWLFYKDGEIPTHVDLPKRLKSLLEAASKHRVKHIKSTKALVVLLFAGGEVALAFATIGLGSHVFLIVLLCSFAVAPVSGAVLFCWEVKKAKDARERAMAMATVASVAGILLTLIVALMSPNQTLSDCACESCSSNEALVDTYQDESYSG